MSTEIAFTEAVKKVQAERGSRKRYARVDWETEVTAGLAAFIGEQTSFFFGTANAAGQPYIQHRGGPAGFLRVLDPTTLAFADYSGNRQYISLGNLSENPKVHLFLIDYANKQRIKIWGEAKVVADDPALLKSLMPEGYKARPEQAIVIKITAWDANCPQHIPQRFEAEDVAAALAKKDARIAELEAELRRLRSLAR
jgi:predicted pyridoxine 5'-phosphate oxidase superfamily flavin-nucleotide-binding protein